MDNVVNLDDLERDIKEMPIPPVRPQFYKDNLPAYVSHGEDTPKIGALSAAAVVKMHEDAAQAIEAMGLEILEETKTLAARYRAQGAERFAEIERISKLADDAKAACAAVKEKIDTKVNEGQ